jgi:hypothetical protein
MPAGHAGIFRAAPHTPRCSEARKGGGGLSKWICPSRASFSQSNKK